MFRILSGPVTFATHRLQIPSPVAVTIARQTIAPAKIAALPVVHLHLLKRHVLSALDAPAAITLPNWPTMRAPVGAGEILVAVLPDEAARILKARCLGCCFVDFCSAWHGLKFRVAVVRRLL